jgi:DNA-binding MarR family transcriptional regulator
MTSELVPSPARAATTAAGPQHPSPTFGDPALGSWRAFLQAHVRLIRRLDEELQAAHGLSLAEYDALFQLTLSPTHRMRMSNLADRVLLSRSGITRLVDRLVADGMVERTVCPTDLRGAEAAITPAGTDRLRAAAVTHLEGIHRLFLDVIPVDEQAAIERGLTRVTDGLGCRPALATQGAESCDSPAEP